MNLIQIEAHDGHRQYVSAGAIARIVQAGASSQWHGIRSLVHLFDGGVIESRNTADELALTLHAAQQASIGDEDCAP